MLASIANSTLVYGKLIVKIALAKYAGETGSFYNVIVKYAVPSKYIFDCTRHVNQNIQAQICHVQPKALSNINRGKLYTPVEIQCKLSLRPPEK